MDRAFIIGSPSRPDKSIGLTGGSSLDVVRGLA